MAPSTQLVDEAPELTPAVIEGLVSNSVKAISRARASRSAASTVELERRLATAGFSLVASGGAAD
jgi:hypothetical protein